MCLRSWVRDAIAAELQAALGGVSTRLDTLGEQLEGITGGLDEETRNLIEWSITKPPMSIWGDIFYNDGETVMIDILARGETLRAVWSVAKSLGFKVAFPENALEVVDLDFGEAFEDWVLKNYNVSAPGELTVGAAAGDPDNIIDTGNTIFELCSITFKVTVGGVNRILVKDLVDGLALFSPKEFEVVI